MKKEKKLIAVDYGTKRVGLAASDPDGRLAFPRRIIANDAALIETLAAFAKEENAEGIVIGESLTQGGAENKVMAEARRLAEILSVRTGLPVHFEKEYFSSVEGRRYQEHTEVDDSAAAIVLQRYLDKMNNSNNNQLNNPQ